MIRTQIYLTEEEHEGIVGLARFLKRRQSEIIRQAIDEYLTRTNPEGKLSRARKAEGIWKDRSDISLSEIRRDFDRY